MHCKSRLGFTLIELLVVVAVIAILAAILFPVFGSARESGRAAHCTSNLAQLGKGFRMYADEWGGWLPTAWTASGWNNWCGQNGSRSGNGCRPDLGQVFPYVRNSSLFLCPKDRNVPALQTAGPAFATVDQKKQYPLSYAMNAKLSRRNVETMQARGRPESGQNQRLSKILLLIHEPRCNIADGSFDPWHSNYANTLTCVRGIHIDGTAVLYADMHAKISDYRNLEAAFRRGEWDPDVKQP